MLRLERVTLPDVPTDRNERPEHTVFQSAPWLDFLAETQRAEPLVAAVLDGNREVGWFTGGVISKLGVRVLGSPFRGWTTSYQGFDLDPGVDRTEAAAALSRFAFGPARCHHIEMLDRWLTANDAHAAGFAADGRWALPGWELGLSNTEEQLFGGLSSPARRCVRRARRAGVVVSRVPLTSMTGQDSFARDYHRQLTQVFARRGLRPTYDEDRVRALLGRLAPVQGLFALRAQDTEGTCVATGLFPFDRRAAYFWGGASTEAGRRLRANDALMWHAILFARSLGCSAFDFGGGGTFKAKFGGAAITVPWVRRSRWRVVETARYAAETMIRFSGKPGRLRRAPTSEAGTPPAPRPGGDPG